MHVALVDPSSDVQNSIAPLLDKQGHKLFSFANTSDALARIKSDTEINALITGAQVGPISGVELCRETRSLAGRQRAIYVLLMSNGDRKTKIEALDCGADDVVDEPPPSDELRAKLRVAERTITLQQDLMRSASTDYLSGVSNRGAFFDELIEAHQETGHGGSLSVILLDVDCFKAINDRYGHDVGDHVIRAVAGAARRYGAPVGRLGGDEFCILLKGHVLNEALVVAAGLQHGLAEVRLETAEEPISVTCSLGVSELQPGDAIDDLIKRADLALYRAKEGGRNCIATTLSNSWMSQRPRLGVSLARLLPRPFPEVRERRNALPPSDELLARVCAVIDLLIASGLSEKIAAQIMAKKMTAAGIPAPKSGEEGNWWQCILSWRVAFRNGAASVDALSEYQDVVAAIESIAPHERVECVLGSDLWDRRRVVLDRRSSAGFLIP